MPTEPESRIYLREAAEVLGRRMGTIRKWEREGVLPKHLCPKRENTGRRWRYFTQKQIDGIKLWIERTQRYPGKGLPHFSPDAEKAEEMIEKMRKPKTAKSP